MAYRTMAYSNVARLALFVFLGAAAFIAGAQEAERGLGKYLPGYEVALYLPAEGRLVLEHADEFLVLRQGDEVPGLPGVKLLFADRDGALLVDADAEGGGAEASPKRWFRLLAKEGGGVEVISISARPDEGLRPPPLEPGLAEHPLVPATPDGGDEEP